MMVIEGVEVLAPQVVLTSMFTVLLLESLIGPILCVTSRTNGKINAYY